MKKVIDGHMYNSATAKPLASYKAELPVSDFGYFEETLYRTKAGLYFLHGKGGPSTKYAEFSYGMYGGGEKIIPLTEEAAKAWGERLLDEDEYEEVFGRVEEDRALIGAQVPESVKKKFDADRKKMGMTAGEYVEYLMPIRLQPPYSEERRQKASQYARENGFSGKAK